MIQLRNVYFLIPRSYTFSEFTSIIYQGSSIQTDDTANILRIFFIFQGHISTFVSLQEETEIKGKVNTKWFSFHRSSRRNDWYIVTGVSKERRIFEMSVTIRYAQWILNWHSIFENNTTLCRNVGLQSPSDVAPHSRKMNSLFHRYKNLKFRIP
jgi:hypothetical protein